MTAVTHGLHIGIHFGKSNFGCDEGFYTESDRDWHKRKRSVHGVGYFPIVLLKYFLPCPLPTEI